MNSIFKAAENSLVRDGENHAYMARVLRLLADLYEEAASAEQLVQRLVEINNGSQKEAFLTVHEWSRDIDKRLRLLKLFIALEAKERGEFLQQQKD